ncbi:MAG: HAD hydrolase family protein [Gemmatimonadetes bacterium]|nr:HAD hydrolase family protein [Gemmatimonadota bacterium]
MSLPPPPTTVVFTDLDGTLLDYDGYTWVPAVGAVHALLETGAALVFCSSKTLAEQRIHQERLGSRHPLIVENGSAIAIPRRYFHEQLDLEAAGLPVHRNQDYDIMVLGVGRDAVLEALGELRTEGGIAFRGYADMTLDDVREMTGLPGDAARRAQLREFSETVSVEGGPEAWQRFLRALEVRGLRSFGTGPTGTVVGRNADKGRAVTLLTGLYRRAASASGDGATPVVTIGIGDAANDEPMLQAVDRAFLVERAGGGWQELEVGGLERIEGVGPVGWSRVISRLLKEDSFP